MFGNDNKTSTAKLLRIDEDKTMNLKREVKGKKEKKL